MSSISFFLIYTFMLSSCFKAFFPYRFILFPLLPWAITGSHAGGGFLPGLLCCAHMDGRLFTLETNSLLQLTLQEGVKSLRRLEHGTAWFLGVLWKGSPEEVCNLAFCGWFRKFQHLIFLWDFPYFVAGDLETYLVLRSLRSAICAAFICYFIFCTAFSFPHPHRCIFWCSLW